MSHKAFDTFQPRYLLTLHGFPDVFVFLVHMKNGVEKGGNGDEIENGIGNWMIMRTLMEM